MVLPQPTKTTKSPNVELIDWIWRYKGQKRWQERIL